MSEGNASAGPSSGRAEMADRPTAERAQSASSVYRRRSTFNFPRAAQPEIVRAYQKDAYYREQLQAQLQDVVRSLLGSRALFQHADLVSFVGALAYFTLSTLGGAQTLGEEYVNAMMTSGKTGKIVGLKRRLSFIFLHIVAPFLGTRLYSAARRRIVFSHQQRTQALQRARLRAQAMAPRRSAQQGSSDVKEPQPTFPDRAIAFFAKYLPSMDALSSNSGVFAYLGAAHLAIFYLGGRYYKWSQRFSKTEYISNIARRPGQQPPSYEVLGFLLGIQLLVKMLMQANRWRSAWMEGRAQERRRLEAEREGGNGAATASSASRAAATGASAEETVEIDGTLWSHKTSPPTRVSSKKGGRGSNDDQDDAHNGPMVPLTYADPDALPSAADLGLPRDVDRAQLEAARAASKVRAAQLEHVAKGVLRCTLCMEQRAPQRGTSAVTECGHVFCWDCIYGWTREKPECPLCRQSLDPSHLLPIYNF